MDEITLAQESFLLVRKDLGLQDDLSLEGAIDPFDRLQHFLEKRIRNMIDHDFSGLLNALYRVDISEHQLRHLLALTPPEQLAHAITQAVLQREKQKVETRRKYKSDETKDA